MLYASISLSAFSASTLPEEMVIMAPLSLCMNQLQSGVLWQTIRSQSMSTEINGYGLIRFL